MKRCGLWQVLPTDWYVKKFHSSDRSKVLKRNLQTSDANRDAIEASAGSVSGLKRRLI